MVWGRKYPYDPFDIIDELHREIDRLFTDFEPMSMWNFERDYDIPKRDIIDEGDKFVVIVELPGISRDEIRMKATRDTIYVEAGTEKNERRKLEGGNYLRKIERSFRTAIRLPEEIIPEKVKARYNNGILEITAPKKNPKEEEGIEISIE